MRAFVTGGTGFIGRHLVRKLRQRGDEVTVLVRTVGKAADLRDLGCQIIEGDLSDAAAIHRGVEDRDAVFHVGAMYKVGIPKSEHAAMRDANVGGTERVLDAATQAGVARIVYVSTGNVYGTPEGRSSPRATSGLSLRSSCPITIRPSTRPIRRHSSGSPPARRS
jgi:dihydroflavonol-4-reductase